MVFVSVTRLRIRKWRYLPAFFYYTLLSAWQARRAAGNLGLSIHRDAGQVYWTITVWRDEAAMREFRNHGAHLRAMPKLRDWCDEATYAHWEQESATPPDLATGYERLIAEGIVSKVKHPSAEHEARAFPRPGGG
jgi:quinol monooxygenase YgiN